MASRQPLPTGGATREEIAKIEIGHTTVGRGTVVLLLAAFLTAIAIVPIAEVAGVPLWPNERSTAWSHFDNLSASIRSAREVAGSSAWGRLVASNRAVLGALTGFETALSDQSVLGRWLRPPAQVVMSRWLGVGNERVYLGREGWLFYRPDVEYVTGQAFLDPAAITRRVKAAPEWEQPPSPDPREAIVGLARDLETRSITLIVMPVPAKPGIHPERLASEMGEASILHNPSHDELLDDLRRSGVVIFDPSTHLTSGRRDVAAYLATDTHWRPEVMEAVAADLAHFLSAQVLLPPLDNPDYVIERQEVLNTGDTARMLDLPAASRLFPPEPVWLRRVLRPDRSLWRSSPDADVLLLGDSFSNIYSLESMGWGTSAGFAEQLSSLLGRPIDRFVQNDQGAFATRSMLQQQPARLTGKRVVIYQFAERELSMGDWKVLPLDASAP